MSPTGPLANRSMDDPPADEGSVVTPPPVADRDDPPSDQSATDEPTATTGDGPARVDVSSLQEPVTPSTPQIRLPRPLPTPTGPPDIEPPAHGPPEPVPPLPPPRSRSRSRVGQGRVVTERLRHVSPLSVLKISGIFYMCLVLVVLVTSVLLWQFARSTGVTDDMENFVSQLFTYGDCVATDDLELGQEYREHDQCPEGQVLVGGFEISDGTLFRAVLLSGAIFVVFATVGTVFMVLLFNLLSDVTGGVRYSVVREPQDAAARSGGSLLGRHRR